MTATQELLKAQSEAVNVEHLTYWRKLMKDLTPLGCAYANGEPRRYYKGKNGSYYYKKVNECELHKRK